MATPKKPVHWADIQKNVFTRWCNEMLKERGMKCEDLETDLKDGLILINLLEAITGKSFGRYNKHPVVPFQKVENCVMAIEFIEKEGIKLVNISGDDIVAGRLKLILGLLWMLIQKYQISEDEKKARQELVQWAARKLPSFGITNLKKDWNDGRALCALCDAIKPGSFSDWSSLDSSEAESNCHKGIECGFNQLGIPKLMAADEISNARVDEHAMFLYLTYYKNLDVKLEAERIEEERKRKEEEERLRLEQERIQQETDEAKRKELERLAEEARLAAEQLAKDEAIEEHKKSLASRCNAFGPGLTECIINEPATFTVINPSNEGEIIVKIEPYAEDVEDIVPQVDKNENGDLVVTYTVTSAGEYGITITCEGFNIPGSRFNVLALDSINLGGEGKIRVFYSTTSSSKASTRPLQELLESKGVHLRPDFEPWIAVDLLTPKDRDLVFKKAATKKLPIVYIDDAYVGDMEKVFELEKSGELDRLLQTNKHKFEEDAILQAAEQWRKQRATGKSAQNEETEERCRDCNAPRRPANAKFCSCGVKFLTEEEKKEREKRKEERRKKKEEETEQKRKQEEEEKKKKEEDEEKQRKEEEERKQEEEKKKQEEKEKQEAEKKRADEELRLKYEKEKQQNEKEEEERKKKIEAERDAELAQAAAKREEEKEKKKKKSSSSSATSSPATTKKGSGSEDGEKKKSKSKKRSEDGKKKSEDGEKKKKKSSSSSSSSSSSKRKSRDGEKKKKSSSSSSSK